MPAPVLGSHPLQWTLFRGDQWLAAASLAQPLQLLQLVHRIQFICITAGSWIATYHWRPGNWNIINLTKLKDWQRMIPLCAATYFAIAIDVCRDTQVNTEIYNHGHEQKGRPLHKHRCAHRHTHLNPGISAHTQTKADALKRWDHRCINTPTSRHPQKQRKQNYYLNYCILKLLKGNLP